MVIFSNQERASNSSKLLNIYSILCSIYSKLLVVSVGANLLKVVLAGCPNTLVFVSYRQSERGEEGIEGVLTWEQQCCLINIYVTESARGRFGHALMSSNTNC